MLFRCPVDGCEKTSQTAHGIRVHCIRGHKMKAQNIKIPDDPSSKRISSHSFKEDIISVYRQLKTDTISSKQIAENLHRRTKYSSSSLDYLKNKIPTFIKHKCAPDIVKDGYGTYRLNITSNPIVETNHKNESRLVQPNPKDINAIDIDNVDLEKIALQSEISRLKRIANRRQEIAIQMVQFLGVLVADDSDV